MPRPGQLPRASRSASVTALGALSALALSSLVGFGSGCGPSFQVIYEGNARFEHCYALEEDPQAIMRNKAGCWRDWSERYTFGQTRDRVHYATARYVALSQMASAPTDEALMMGAPGEIARGSTITAPAPTNAFAPPPKILDPSEARVATVLRPSDTLNVPTLSIDAGAPGLPPALAPAPVLPAATCADACSAPYQTCSGGCGAPAAAKSAPCQACLKTYRACMRSCFK